jgi:hypothetical protein
MTSCLKPLEISALKRKTVRKKTSSKSCLLNRGDINIEFESFFRNQIEGLLIVSSWSERFRADIGFKGVSQVWGGPPAWYLWLADAPGVYHLKLLQAEEEALNNTNLCRAIFVVKCYPYPDNGCFQSFSFLEQKFIQSKFFDGTHTPVFEYREKIPPELFNVATLELTMDHEAHMALFCLETLDVLRSRYADKADQVFPSMGLDRQFDKDEIDRDIPGLEIAYPLFDCLMCLYSNAGRQTPLRIRCSKSPGFEFMIHRGKLDIRPSDDITDYRLRVLYSSADCRQPTDMLAFRTGLMETGETTLYDRMFPCGHFHKDQGERKLPISINEKWWTLAHMQYVSELTSTCGCH